MKTSLFPVIAILLSSNVLSFAIEIPSSLRTASEIEKAKTDAAARKKPIAVLQSSRDATCPYTVGGTMDAIKEFRTKTVMIYVDRGEETSLPKNVQDALASVRSFPRTVIMDPTMTNVIATAGYARDPAQQQKIFKEATKKMRDGTSASAGATASAGTDSFGSFFNKAAK